MNKKKTLEIIEKWLEDKVNYRVRCDENSLFVDILKAVNEYEM